MPERKKNCYKKPAKATYPFLALLNRHYIEYKVCTETEQVNQILLSLLDAVLLNQAVQHRPRWQHSGCGNEPWPPWNDSAALQAGVWDTLALARPGTLQHSLWLSFEGFQYTALQLHQILHQNWIFFYFLQEIRIAPSFLFLGSNTVFRWSYKITAVPAEQSQQHRNFALQPDATIVKVMESQNSLDWKGP